MSKIVTFKYNNIFKFSDILLDSGEKCFVSVGRDGVIVKDKKMMFFGSILYKESNIDVCARTSFALRVLYPHQKINPDVSAPVLREFVNAILHCKDSNTVSGILNSALKDYEADVYKDLY